jgi:hypothetical protein
MASADAGGEGAIRGRLKRLLVLGIPTQPGPGTGERRAYTRDDVEQLLVAFELQQLSVRPEHAALMIKKHWNVLGAAFSMVRRAGPDNHVYLYTQPKAVTDSVSPHRDEDLRGVPLIGFFRRYDFRRSPTGEKKLQDLFQERLLPLLSGQHPRLHIVNLTLEKQRFDEALANAKEPKP